MVRRTLNKDDSYAIRATVSVWIADPQVQLILSTGGTGFTSRDSAPEALAPLFDETAHGFGELFRQVSCREIGASTIESRALTGLANAVQIFALPGSNNAVPTGWEKIINPQLDITTNKPCNFAKLFVRFAEA